MSTLKEQLGYRHEVVDRQLAHAQKDKLESAYDRASYLEERRAMMQRWAGYLDEMAVASLQRRSEVRQVRAEEEPVDWHHEPGPRPLPTLSQVTKFMILLPGGSPSGERGQNRGY